MASSGSDPINLNVGGVIYTTSRSTLTHYPDSMLGAMFSGSIPTARDQNGNYFIDRDGHLFRHVLNFLRTSELNLPEDFKEISQLKAEADFYCIQPLQGVLDRQYVKPSPSHSDFIYLQETMDRFDTWYSDSHIFKPHRKRIDTCPSNIIMKETLPSKYPYLEEYEFKSFSYDYVGHVRYSDNQNDDVQQLCFDMVFAPLPKPIIEFGQTLLFHGWRKVSEKTFPLQGKDDPDTRGVQVIETWLRP